MKGKEKPIQPTQATAVKETEQTNANVVLVPYKQEQKVMIVCDVCGHANPQYTAICQQCSNYLLD